MSYIIGRAARLSLSRVRIVDHGYSSFKTSQILSLRAEHFSTQPKDRGNFKHPVHLSEELSEEAERFHVNRGYTSFVTPKLHEQRTEIPFTQSLDRGNVQGPSRHFGDNTDGLEKRKKNRHLRKWERVNFLAATLRNVEDNKEYVYGTLDSWVAWHIDFPIAEIKMALNILEKEKRWHRIVQVIKWLFSKGQGNTVNTHSQFMLALDMDNRSEEAHEFWVAKIRDDLEWTCWNMCRQMLIMYNRNKNFDRVVELFEELEKVDRRPREKETVDIVVSAYEHLGRVVEKEMVLKKYKKIRNTRSPRTSGLHIYKREK